MKQFMSAITFMFLALTLAQAQSPVGLWKTIDDDSGEAKSQVEIYEQNGKFYGKVTQLLLKPNDTLCGECSGAKKNKPVVGMIIIDGLEAEDGYWKNGDILDPESGSVYGCSVWFEDGKTDEMQLRGRHWTGLYRTQTWYRIK